MKWDHKASTDWLKARQSVLTATDIESLVPAYKKYLKAGGSEIPPAFAGLWAEKTYEGELNPYSTGAAARGHIMEEYAIESYNRQPEKYHCQHYNYWDDALIYANGVGFSPDGLDVCQSIGSPMLPVSEVNPRYLVEVKSYSPGVHMQTYLKYPVDLKERLQVAPAFHVCPTLEEACVLFYCPDARISMFTRYYDRVELEEELELVAGIVDAYQKIEKELNDIPAGLESLFTEQEIYDEYVKMKESLLTLV
jgi:hypothetical protein